MTNEHMKRRSASLAIKEMQIKIAMRYRYTAAGMAETKTPQHHVLRMQQGGCRESGSRTVPVGT